MPALERSLTVLLPVHNAQSTLNETVSEILDVFPEFSPRFDVLIVDDGSSDGSRDLATAFARTDRRVRILQQDHLGVAEAMNLGVQAARGPWVARMDGDDIAVPDRLAACLAWAGPRKLDVCGGQAEWFGAATTSVWFPEDHEAIARELLFRCPILYPAAMVRREALGAFPHAAGSVFDDYELFTALALRWRLGNAPQVLLRHRVHDRQTSALTRPEVWREFRKHRFTYFYARYPGTPLVDYLPLARLSDQQPQVSGESLERAGRWLVALAEHPDQKLQRRMAERWEAARRQSPVPGSRSAGLEAIDHRFGLPLEGGA